MKIRSLDGKTPDIAEENIQKLKQIFPDVFTEDKVDFEKLQQVLGEYVEDSTERYNFTWNGKGRALRLSQTPSLGTLRPCKEESKDWDTTQNLYIEGDNLEVLKLLQKSYHSKVKMIYIDPPYNTGKDFVYKDDFHDSLENYKRITGQVDKDGNRLSTNTEASGRYHTDWLNMMYPRLRLARNLLTDDGIIFISIDDNEVDNLKKICNEVFGEDNFISAIIPIVNPRGAQSSNHIAVNHEYILCFSKTKELETFGLELTDKQRKEYNEKDKKGRFRELGLRKRGADSRREDSPSLFYPIYFNEKTGDISTEIEYDIKIIPKLSDGSYGRWRWSAKKVEKDKEQLLVRTVRRAGEDEWDIFTKDYLTIEKRRKPMSLWDEKEVNNEFATELIKGLFDEKVFSYPKSLFLLKRILTIATMEDAITLDFFSGSATTAHAVMQLNAEDGGNRKFIMVQLPEPTEEKDEAYKAGYMNICEIGKERIRRAGEKIKEENRDKENIENLDIGFKVLKLDTSNIRKWQPDYDNLEQSLLDYVDNYMEGRTELDVVYEIMLKYGLDLTYPVDEFILVQKKVYSIGFGMLMICLDDEITTEVAKGILEKVKELAPESTRVVFKDNGFKTDSNKTNIKEILKSGGIEEFITI